MLKLLSRFQAYACAKWAELQKTTDTAVTSVNRPSVREFLLLAWQDFLARMSGAFSVPFWALAVFSDSSRAQAIWSLLAVCSLLVCTYRVWATERARARVLSEKIAPKLILEFGAGDPFVHDVDFTHPPTHPIGFGPRGIPMVSPPSPPSKFRCYRFKVTNGGQQELRSCKAEVKRAWSDYGVRFVQTPFSLGRPPPERDSFALRIGEEKMVDILVVPIAGPAMQFGVRFAKYGDAWTTVATYLASTAITLSEPATIAVQVLSEATSPTAMTLRLERGADGLFELRKLHPGGADSPPSAPP